MLTDREVLTLQAEARRRRRDPQLIQNLEMHSRILKSWERERPAMWARLQSQNLAETMAFLAQQRMWEEQERLVNAGMPITDAREEAERNHLMWGPEEQTETTPPEEEMEEAEPEVPEPWEADLEQQDAEPVAAMLPTVAQHRAQIAGLCRRFHVRRLDLFGSAARGEAFDPARSDLDLLVEYEPSHTPPALADFLALRAALETLLGYRVDLAMTSAIRNPYLRASIDAVRLPLHAA